MNKTSLSVLIGRCDSELVIALEEGFYSQEWLWFPGILQADVEAWWSALENVETFWNEGTRAAWPGEFVPVDENIESSGLWERVWNSAPLRARIDLNEQFDLAKPDTYLRRSNGTVLLHKGAFQGEDSGNSNEN